MHVLCSLLSLRNNIMYAIRFVSPSAFLLTMHMHTFTAKRSNTKSFPSVTKHVEPSPKAMKALLQGTMLVKSDTESVDSMSLRTAYASKTSSLPFYESEEPLTKNKDLLVQPPTHPPAELQDLTDKWTPP